MGGSCAVLKTTQFTGRVVRALVARRAEELAVGEFLIATGAQGLSVVELFGGQTTVPVVRAPARGALARAAGPLANQPLHRFGKTHASEAPFATRMTGDRA